MGNSEQTSSTSNNSINNNSYDVNNPNTNLSKENTKDSNYKGNLSVSPIASKLMELFEDCQTKSCEYIIDFFDEETQNPKYWLIIYNGIEGTPYEKGLFKVKLVFPDDFPNSMPKAYFLTKIYHLNIRDPADGGDVCLKNYNKGGQQVYDHRGVQGLPERRRMDRAAQEHDRGADAQRCTEGCYRKERRRERDRGRGYPEPD